MKGPVHRTEQAIAIEKAAAPDQAGVLLEQSGDFGERFGNGGFGGVGDDIIGFNWLRSGP